MGQLPKLAECLHVEEEVIREHFSHQVTVRSYRDFTTRKGKGTVLLPYIKKSLEKIISEDWIVKHSYTLQTAPSLQNPRTVSESCQATQRPYIVKTISSRHLLLINQRMGSKGQVRIISLF